MQNSDVDMVADAHTHAHDNRREGNGVFLSPWTGGTLTTRNQYYRHNKNPNSGEGLADFFKSGIDFFTKHSGTIANAANAAGGIANVIKTAKDIKRADEELYEMKRIREDVASKKQEPTFTKAQLEIMDKIRKTGNGIKVL